MQITVTGVNNILKRIDGLLKIEEKCAELARRLCEIGEPIIRQVHGNHASVWSEPTENGYKIVAEGEDVLFIEFGAGNAAGSTAGLYDAVPAEVRPGSWSETHAKQYVMYGNWWFGGQAYVEVVPTPAFYYAYEYMAQNLPQLAKEVFSS